MSTLDRRDRGDMIVTYNIINHRVEMDARFMKMNTESRRGHTMKLKISRSKIEIRRNFFHKQNKEKMEWSKPKKSSMQKQLMPSREPMTKRKD